MKITVKIFAAILALFMVFGMASCDKAFEFVKDTVTDVVGDIFDEDEIVLEYNGIQVDDKMMGFFFNNRIITFYDTYGAYLGYLSVNFKDDLKNQQFGSDGSYESMLLGNFEGSWHDYFMESTLEDVKLYMVYADYAQSNGIQLSEADEQEIDSMINDITDNAKTRGLTLEDCYGNGVDEDVVHRCCDLMVLSEKGAAHMTDKFDDRIDEEDIFEWCDEHEEMYSAKCLSYSIKVSGKGKTQTEFNSMCVLAMNTANKIARAGSVENFKNLVADAGKNQPDELQMDKTYSTKYVSSAENGLVSRWIYGDPAPKKGDTTVIDNTVVSSEDKEKYDVYTVTVYYLVEPQSLNSSLTHNFAYVIANNEKTAEDILEALKSEDVYDIDDFSEFFEDNDFGDSVEFGWMENCVSGALEYGELNSWIDSEEREDGELSSVIKYNTGSQGLHFYKYNANEFSSGMTVVTPGADYEIAGKDDKTDEKYESDKKDQNGGYVISGPIVNDNAVKLDGTTIFDYTIVGGDANVVFNGGERFAVILFDSYGEETYKVIAKAEIINEEIDKWSSCINKVIVYDAINTIEFESAYTPGFMVGGPIITDDPSQNGSFTIITTPGGVKND